MAQASGKVFVTWENLCFDRCASIWLVRTFVDSTAEFEFIPFGQRVKHGISFDVPGAELGRQRNISCFESIILKYEIEDTAIRKMAKIIHDIDVNTWGPKVTVEADSLEEKFMEIQHDSRNETETILRTRSLFEAMYQANRKRS